MTLRLFLWALLGLGPLSLCAAPAVSIVKSASKTNPKVLDTLRYSLVVDNTGSNTATAVSVSDLVPAGLTVVGISPGGSLAGGTITWSLGSLYCQSQVVTLTAISDVAGG